MEWGIVTPFHIIEQHQHLIKTSKNLLTFHIIHLNSILPVLTYPAASRSHGGYICLLLRFIVFIAPDLGKKTSVHAEQGVVRVR